MSHPSGEPDAAPRLPSLSALPLLFAALGGAAMAQTPPMAPDIPADKFATTVPNADYTKQEVMIPMRDGVKLHTVIVIPKACARRTRRRSC
jgi:predicted acyl esterase